MFPEKQKHGSLFPLARKIESLKLDTNLKYFVGQNKLKNRMRDLSRDLLLFLKILMLKIGRRNEQGFRFVGR